MYNNNNMLMNQSTHLNLLDLRIMSIVKINPKSILECKEAITPIYVGPNLIRNNGNPKHKPPRNTSLRLDMQ
jgi:hypothetical protein